MKVKLGPAENLKCVCLLGRQLNTFRCPRVSYRVNKILREYESDCQKLNKLVPREREREREVKDWRTHSSRFSSCLKSVIKLESEFEKWLKYN